MKTNHALVFGMLLTSSLVAQTNSSSPVAPAPTPAPAAATVQAAPTKPAAAAEKPAAKPAVKKAAVKKTVVVEKPVSLLPGPATVDARNVNVRGRSSVAGEVLVKLNKGDTVTVLEQVENKWAKGTDPKQWARIAYPSNAAVWVFASFVDAGKTVTVPKLNLRGGPGENYSIVGRLAKGAVVKEIAVKGEWMRIEPPAEASAYVAGIYLKQDPTQIAGVEPVKPPTAPASTNVITDVEPPVPGTVDTAGTNDLAAFVAGVSGGSTNVAAADPDAPLPARRVSREGILRNATSIQAPSHYSLVGLETGRTINYLYTTSTNVNLNRYNALHVIVEGEESLDERWPNTPVLTLQKIQVVEE